jgi:hypothetical protein
MRAVKTRARKMRLARRDYFRIDKQEADR